MNNRTHYVLSVLILLSFSNSCFAWTMTHELRVTRVQGADAFTVAFSPGSEAGIPYHGLQVYAEITEEGTLVGTDSDNCFREGNNDVECIALARDLTTSVLCEYCGSGQANIINDVSQSLQWGPICKVLPPAGPRK